MLREKGRVFEKGNIRAHMMYDSSCQYISYLGSSDEAIAPVPINIIFAPDVSEADGVIQSVSHTDITIVTKTVIKASNMHTNY
jgi:hypothetical protein